MTEQTSDRQSDLITLVEVTAGSSRKSMRTCFDHISNITQQKRLKGFNNKSGLKHTPGDPTVIGDDFMGPKGLELPSQYLFPGAHAVCDPPPNNRSQLCIYDMNCNSNCKTVLNSEQPSPQSAKDASPVCLMQKPLTETALLYILDHLINAIGSQVPNRFLLSIS